MNAFAAASSEEEREARSEQAREAAQATARQLLAWWAAPGGPPPPLGAADLAGLLNWGCCPGGSRAVLPRHFSLVGPVGVEGPRAGNADLPPVLRVPVQMAAGFQSASLNGVLARRAFYRGEAGAPSVHLEEALARCSNCQEGTGPDLEPILLYNNEITLVLHNRSAVGAMFGFSAGRPA